MEPVKGPCLQDHCASAMNSTAEHGKPSLLDMSPVALTSALARRGEPKYRVQQVQRWVYQRFASNFSEMTNLSGGLRQSLAEAYDVWPLSLGTYGVSKDRDTLKALFQLQDGECVEAVLMLYDRRQTLCISSQVGCAMGCTFCATGLDGLTRNLTAGEIVGQVLALARMLDRREELRLLLDARQSHVSNIVFMGMGEPFHNYGAVWDAVRIMAAPDFFGLSPRNITISTVGLVPQIRAMAQEPLPVRMAISLHAPNDELRARIVPPARRWPIAEILGAARHYIHQTGRRVTFEYVMLDGLNDDPRLGTELGQRLRGLNCHVNLIPFNPIPGDRFQPSPMSRTQAFATAVKRSGIATTIRVRRGIEMDAGCGQLRKRIDLQSQAR